MISFLIPCYNESKLIQRCVWSIHNAARNYEILGGLVYEVLAIDNGSTDNTTELAESAGAIVLVEPYKGVTRARQTGFKAAKYDLIACIDADAELPVDWLDYALKAINKPNVVVASGPVVYHELSQPKRILTFVFYCVAKITNLFWPVVQGGNFIVRRWALEQAGGFNTDIEFYGEDTDTAMRLSKVGKVVFNLDMWAYTSARRVNEEGMFLMGFWYIINYISVWVLGKPWNTKYRDYRSP